MRAYTTARTVLITLLALAGILPATAENKDPDKDKGAGTPCVRVVYLVSSNRTVNAAYRAAAEHAIRDIRQWVAGQMDGKTFQLHDPVVEVVQSDKSAAWFTENPARSHRDSWGFHNALSEARRLLGARPHDNRYCWVIYSDGPGNKGRAVKGFAYLPEDDLLGLVGKHPKQKDRKRWIAGLGHELGHAFGLGHPTDTRKHADAIMWTGIYGKYPDKCYLTPEDKRILAKSPFIRR